MIRSVILTFFLTCALCAQAAGNKTDSDLLKEAKESFSALPESLIDVKAEAPLISLGKKLYFETKLSANDKISCNSCHDLKKFGVDNKSFSPGHVGQLGGRNSPTVYNSGLNFRQFWDGRAENLEEQAGGPILNPKEMAMPSEEKVIEKLAAIPAYTEDFKKVFAKDSKPLTYKNLTAAIAAFEKTLLTPSAFDRFLAGDLKALNTKEKKGLATFMEVGCVSCHQGANIGGSMYQKLGLVQDYPTKDTGRFEVTKDPEEKFFFKVPSLRNIAKTGPYFHDGSINKLSSVVKVMGRHQLGVELTTTQVNDIVAFLNSLTGKLPQI